MILWVVGICTADVESVAFHWLNNSYVIPAIEELRNTNVLKKSRLDSSFTIAQYWTQIQPPSQWKMQLNSVWIKKMLHETTHPALSFRLAIENIAWRRLQQNVISLQRRTIIKSRAETLIACFHTSQLVLLMSSKLSFEIRSLKNESESTFNVWCLRRKTNEGNLWHFRL